MHSKKTLVVFVTVVLLFATFPMLFQPQMTTEALVKIDPNLLEQMQTETGPYKVMVKVKWHPDLEPIKFNHDAVIAELKAEAAETQAPVIAYLKQKRDAQILNTFWLCNYILVSAEESTIRELATLTTVEKIIMNFEVKLPEGETFTYITLAEASPSSATWNVEKVRAPEVWEVLGLTGEGIKFATTDTGLDITHPDLEGTLFTANPADPKYPGGWIEFDADGNPVWSTPHDTYGHGTATYGLIVGDAKNPSIGAVGVAPGAAGLGMHALTLPGGGGYWPQVLAGLQWCIDPFDEAGNHYPPARVSSHSWGGTGYNCYLVEAVENMYWTGHVCVVSIGNDYEGYSSTPGNYYSVIGVGATDVDDYVASFSSGEWVYKTDYPCTMPDWWPDQWIKPEVSAPGVDCICPYPGNQYVYWSGTSFSSPHVAGAAMLMLQGNPSLTPEEIEQALEETSVWYDRYYPTRPDTRYGWGRIDAYEAVMLVALPQGVKGYVTDASTNAPIYKAKVYCHEMDRTVYTDENGFYDMRLPAGTYTLTFSKFGYEEQTITGVEVVANQFTWVNVALTPVPPGYVAGYVYFEPTGIGIPGALVEALDVPDTVQVETDADGYYVLPIPPGTYDFKASAVGFKEDIVEDVTVVEGETTVANFYLTQPPVIAVVGDYPTSPGKVTAFLKDKGYMVDAYTTIASIIPNVPKYQTIIVNYPGYWGAPSTADMANFITVTDQNGVGVVWLDSWSSGTGGYYLWYHSYYYGLPIGFSFYRYTGYRYGSYPDVYNYYHVVREDSDILDAWPVSTRIPIDMGVWHDSAYYRMYTAESDSLRYLANLGFYYYGSYYDYYTSVVKYTRTNNKWIMLSAHATTYYVDIGNLHPDAKTILLNSINWASKEAVPHAKFVVWDLKAEPKVGLWKDPRTVSVGIKNVGWVEGTDKVEMYVDTTLEGTATVTLAPGAYVYPSWTTSRFDVGTYKVTVRHLTTTFIVRPPQITVQVYEYCTNQPLAGADVYGYYRKYVAPGWYEQWSYAYGGYGHSQFAQPVGDLDCDGINEVIVGGYESLGNGRCRILSFDAATGTYIEEYSWTHGGGTYNSPSGATMLDLDGDGKLELIVSWSYSGSNDGVWAYKWDGTTLTPLDHWYGGFVFDVYAGDYDDDGVTEVLVANAPWGVTYAQVVVLGWEGGHFVEETSWIHPSYTSFECMMLWTADVDIDGKTEVVVSLADSYYSNGGTWALEYSSGTWTYTLVYMDLINGGTHYGVVAGDVNGNGIPEIGIGNNPSGYTGAGAVLIEWDPTTSTYKKVWEGTWATEYGIIEAVYIGDADNDGNNEFIAGGGYIHIIGWDGTKYYEKATITMTSGMLSGAIIGDCDSDGKNEIKACDIIGYGPGKEWIFKYAEEPTPLPTWEFKYFGTTDENGKLTFNSPASVVDMYLFVYKGEKSALGYQYLLEKDLYIDDDVTVTYTPHKNTEAIIISKLKSAYLDLFVYQHLGITWLQKGELPILWPFVGTKCDPAKVIVTPETYTIRHMLNINDAYGAWWYYFMAPDRMVTLSAKQTYSYYWAGPIQGFIEMTQTDNVVNINWDVTDSYNHHITGVTLIEANWLTSSSEASTTPIPIKPGILEDIEIEVAQTLEHYANIALYTYEGYKRVLVKSGYVKWDEKQFSITVQKTIKYVTLSFLSGPYGNPFGPMYVTVIARDYA